jgi:hypothetical protein
MKGAPIYGDTLALCGVLLLEVVEEGDRHRPLRARLSDGALRLLDQVTLAVGGFDRLDRLEAADAELRALRAHLLLALELGVIEEDDFLALAEQGEAISRQIGGWMKKLGRREAHASTRQAGR